MLPYVVHYLSYKDSCWKYLDDPMMSLVAGAMFVSHCLLFCWGSSSVSLRRVPLVPSSWQSCFPWVSLVFFDGMTCTICQYVDSFHFADSLVAILFQKNERMISSVRAHGFCSPLQYTPLPSQNQRLFAILIRVAY